MSKDKTKNFNVDPKAKSGGFDWLAAATGMLGAYAVSKMFEPTKEESAGRACRACSLAPGMVIRVASIDIMVIGVRICEVAELDSPALSQFVQVGGAPTTNRGVDWQWNKKEVEWESPFLQFKPDTVVEVIRETPFERSTLESFLDHDKDLQPRFYKEGLEIGERVGVDKGYERALVDVRKVLVHHLDRAGQPTNDFEKGLVEVLESLSKDFSQPRLRKLLKEIADAQRGTEDAPAPPPPESEVTGSSQLFKDKLD